MPKRATILTAAAFLAAFVLSGFIAGGSATVIEMRTRKDIRLAMEENGHGWVSVYTDGLQVVLQGTAPSEAARFRAVTVASRIVDAARILDNTDVENTDAIAPPAFSLEVLRNDDGISLIGLVPSTLDRAALVEGLKTVAADGKVTDMLEAADYPVPQGWELAMDFALETLKTLPRAKISVDPGAVAVEAITDSPAEKARVETSLARRRPADLKVKFDIAAPRPVITPFTLRFVMDAEGPRFDACSADTARARDRILAAAREAGAKGTLGCTIGMGTPSPDWGAASAMAIGALKELGAGTVTFSDADIVLSAADTVAPAAFDKVVGELESNLPEVFSLKAELQKTEAAAGAVPEFTATLSPEGKVDLRGRVLDARQRDAVENFARARFGSDAVYGGTRVDGDLPAGWPARTLAGLEALAQLEEGKVVVRPDLVSVEGISGNKQASDIIARILARGLGEAAPIDLALRYDARLDPALSLPDGASCVARLNAVLADHKITFEPGSAKIAAEGEKPVEALVTAMKGCENYRMELAGHTDSQGSEAMNQELSQARAAAVLSALRTRRVLTGNITAKGYGESQPIADNGTEEGREANRRIEFVLLDEKPVGEAKLEVLPAPKRAPEGVSALQGDDAALEFETEDAGPMEQGGTMDDAPPIPEGEAAAADAPAEAPAEPAAEAVAEPATAPTPEPAPADTPAADLPPEVAAAQDPAIEIPVAPADTSPARPKPRPARN